MTDCLPSELTTHPHVLDWVSSSHLGVQLFIHVGQMKRISHQPGYSKALYQIAAVMPTPKAALQVLQ